MFGRSLVARKLFDLDSFMILVTFIAASGHSLVEIYDLYVTLELKFLFNLLDSVEHMQ